MTDTPRAAFNPTRRDVLQFGGAGLAATALAGCNALSTDPAGEEGKAAPSASSKKGDQAPALAAQVKKGKLPSVKDRMPDKPMVVKGDEIGRYGGDLSLLMLGIGGDRLDTTIGYENLLRYTPDATSLTENFVIANVAESYEVGADGAEFTFKLRPGMKWSDGEPFTADDIVFWYEHVETNRELRPVTTDWLDTGGDTPLVVKKLDDHTVQFRFSAPNGLFLINMATQRGKQFTQYPAHYMKQFHKLYAKDIEQQTKDAKLDHWMDLFNNKANMWDNPDLPVLNAWTVSKRIGASTQRVVTERNPYYWKTDSDGSQLPYVDRVTFEVVQESQAAVLKVTNGDVDVVGGGNDVAELRNKPVFARNRKKGDYRFFDTIPQNMNQMVLMVNMTHKDPVLRKIFANKDFRIGLSYGIDRESIINTVYARQGQPWQAAPRPESPYYNKELAKQYTAFDKAKANAYLDKVVPEKNSDGVRMRPDGKPLSFQIDVIVDQKPRVDALNMVHKQWKELGIDMRVKSEAADLFFKRMDGNLHDGAVWEGAGGLGTPLDSFYWVPQNFNTRYAMPWHFWTLNPDDERAEKPPPETLKQIELYRDMIKTGDRKERVQKMKQVVANSIDLFYCMGVALEKRQYGLVKNKLGNTPELSITGWLYGRLAPTNFPLYFWKDKSTTG